MMTNSSRIGIGMDKEGKYRGRLPKSYTRRTCRCCRRNAAIKLYNLYRSEDVFRVYHAKNAVCDVCAEEIRFREHHSVRSTRPLSYISNSEDLTFTPGQKLGIKFTTGAAVAVDVVVD